MIRVICKFNQNPLLSYISCLQLHFVNPVSQPDKSNTDTIVLWIPCLKFWIYIQNCKHHNHANDPMLFYCYHPRPLLGLVIECKQWMFFMPLHIWSEESALRHKPRSYVQSFPGCSQNALHFACSNTAQQAIPLPALHVTYQYTTRKGQNSEDQSVHNFHLSRWNTNELLYGMLCMGPVRRNSLPLGNSCVPYSQGCPQCRGACPCHSSHIYWRQPYRSLFLKGANTLPCVCPLRYPSSHPCTGSLTTTLRQHDPNGKWLGGFLVRFMEIYLLV